MTLSNSDVYGLSRARISNFTKDEAGKFDGFTATVSRVFIQGRHVTNGKSSLAPSGAFTGSGFYMITLKSKIYKFKFEMTLIFQRFNCKQMSDSSKLWALAKNLSQLSR